MNRRNVECYPEYGLRKLVCMNFMSGIRPRSFDDVCAISEPMTKEHFKRASKPMDCLQPRVSANALYRKCNYIFGSDN